MAKRYFNWKLAVVLIMGLAVLAATAFGLRHWQRSRRYSQGIALGTKAYNQGKWQEATEQFGRYLSVVPDDVSILLKYADSQLNIRPFRANNGQQAIAAYRTVLRLESGNVDAAYSLSQLYLGIGMAGDAEQVARKALQYSQSPKLRAILAVAMAGQRKFIEAADELENVIKDNPAYLMPYDILGKLIERRPEDFNVPPQFWFDEVVKNNPSSAQAFIIRGEYYLRHGEKTRAVNDFNSAAKMDFDDPNIRLQLADNFVAAGDFQQARRQIEIVAGQNSSNQTLWRIWAQLVIKSGDSSTMMEVADNGLKSLSLQPWDFMPFAAELYIRAGQLDKASECISKLRKNDIQPSTTAFLEGLLAEVKGQGYEAVKCWQRAIDQGAEPGTVKILLANALANLGDTQSAIKQLRSLISEQPKNVRAKVELARLLGESGKWDESLEHAGAAVQLAPQDIGAAVAYARARVYLMIEGTARYNSAAGEDIEKYLRKLDDSAGGLIDVKLLELQLAMHRNDFNEAQVILNRLKTEYPADIRVVLAETNLLAAQDKINEAAVLLNNAIDKYPDSFILVRALAGLLSFQGAKQQCEDMINRAVANTKQASVKKQMHLLLAGLYANWNEEKKRCDLLGSLISQYPDDIVVLRTALTCSTILKDLPKAQKIVDSIKTIEGEKGWQWRYEQARVWFARDDFKTVYPQIVLLLKENLLADQDNQASRMLLAAAYEKAGDMRLAIATYEEALSRSPGDVRITVVTAGALYKAREYDRADQILRRAMENKPESQELKRMQFQGFMRRGEFDSASTVLKGILASDPNNLSIGLSLALLQMQEGHLDDAARTLDALDAGTQNFLPIAAAKAELKIRQGKPDEAIEMCNEAVQKFGDASAMVLRARTLAYLGQNDKAEIDLNRAALAEPNNIEVWLAKSDFYRTRGHLNEAIADINHAIQLDPASQRATKLAILLYLASPEVDKRREGALLLDNALQANPYDAELRLYKARLLISQDTSPALNNAKGILDSLTEQQPLNSEAWQLLTEVASRQGQSAEAMDIVLRGLAHMPNDKRLLLMRAKLLKKRSPMLAVPVLRALWELDPNDNETLAYLAEVFIETGEYGQAINLIKAQLDMQNNPSVERQLKTILGAALYKAGNQDEAEIIFTALQQSMPDDPAPLITKIRLLEDAKAFSQISDMVQMWRQSHPDDFNVPFIVAGDLAAGQDKESQKLAEKILMDIIQQKPDSSGALYSLAMLLQTTGRLDEAAELYQRVISLDSNFVVAVNNLSWILCENKKQYQTALELADKALQQEPNYIDLLDTRGMIYYRLDRFELAVEDFNRCVTLYPAGKKSLTSSYLHLARALEKLGKTSQAYENARKAMSLNNTAGGLTDVELADAGQLLQKLSQGGN